MTLLGKLFRPWDLPQEDTEKPESSPNLNLPRGDSSTSASDRVSSSSPCDTSSKEESLKDASDNPPPSPIDIDNEDDVDDKEEERGENTKLSWSRCASEPSQSGCLSPSNQNIDQFFLHPSAISNLANLSRTELTAMGLLPSDHSSLKVKRQRPKRFHCPHCQVAFSNNGQLRGHIRIHTGERPFTCDHEGCGKSFTRNEELTRHRRIHSGVRPYPCSYCGKKFGRKDHLKKHTRTHQRPTFGGGMIGFGNPLPFHPFNPPLVPNGFNSLQQPSYGLPFVLGMPPPNSHFHFS